MPPKAAAISRAWSLGRCERSMTRAAIPRARTARAASQASAIAFGRPAAPTDVLSFSMCEGAGAEFRGELLGDVVISIERASEQAARRSVPIDQELRELLIHGLLHLLGMDHERPEDARRMREMEKHLRWELERLPA